MSAMDSYIKATVEELEGQYLRGMLQEAVSELKANFEPGSDFVAQLTKLRKLDDMGVCQAYIEKFTFKSFINLVRDTRPVYKDEPRFEEFERMLRSAPLELAQKFIARLQKELPKAAADKGFKSEIDTIKQLRPLEVVDCFVELKSWDQCCYAFRETTGVKFWGNWAL